MSLYGDVEEMHSIELRRTAGSVREAERAIGLQEKVVRSADLKARIALAGGDRVDWTIARTQRDIAEWKQQRLQEVRLEREILKNEATKQYLASRLQSEQMRHVVNGAAAQEAVETRRRAQAALDDRFLARRRWTDTRDESRKNAKMNDS